MRVLLAQNMRFLPSHGGANRANRILMEGLAARGHRCVAVTPLHATEHRLSTADLTAYLAGLGVTATDTGDALVYTHRGVEVHAVLAGPKLPRYLRAVAAEEEPDRVLVPSDDPGLLMLGTALRAAPDRVVYLVHTLQQLPFGPRAFYPSESGVRLVRRAAAVVAISRAGRDYVRQHAGIDASLIYPPVYGTGPWPRADGGGAVTMVNPCGFKGLPILLGLADALPGRRFLAVPTWGTTAADREQLAARPNIDVIAPVDDIGTLFARTRVLLMPSLWDETFGYTAVEAMLHGVPVLAADVGGLGEAKLGVPYLLPVTPITRYEPGTLFPQPVLPPQDPAPWLDALRRLDDPGHHAEVAAAGRHAARSFVDGLDAEAFPHLLEKCG
ncbi:glycosyltransferase family 4 protein [Dactylosporangium sp. NPDC049742]|uniref:glycosyltransferase family 4 protein n=1 Tax=Dactylosporangium sp. NPDC049742 TaxID=3154737 RepID=UPI003423B3AB